jgi:hypothetical protein
MDTKQTFTIDQQMRYLFAYLGLNEVELLHRVRLPCNLLNQKSMVLSAEEYCQLLEAIATSDSA